MITTGYLRGKTMYFTRYHLVYFWYQLTRQQRLGFETTYRAGCKCQVSGLLSNFPLQPRHCPCPIFLQPGLSPPCPLSGWPLLLHLLPTPWPPPPFPFCFLLPSLFPWASTCIQAPVALVFWGWGVWTGGGKGVARGPACPSTPRWALPPLLAHLPSTWSHRLCVETKRLRLQNKGRKPGLVLHVRALSVRSVWMDPSWCVAQRLPPAMNPDVYLPT